MRYQKSMKDSAARVKEQKEEMARQITELVEDFRMEPGQIAEYLAFAEKFSYHYSPRNTMLMYRQNPGARFCQSFAAWKAQGWSVLRGQHGMKVYVPVSATILTLPDGSRVPLKYATDEQRQEYKLGMIPGEKALRFAVGTTFDVAQTNFPADRYPELISRGCASEEHRQCVEALCEFSGQELGCPVIRDGEEERMGAGQYGCYIPDRHEIHLSPSLEDTRSLLTLVHELGHAFLHNAHDGKAGALSVSQKEFESDCVRFLLCCHLGFPLDAPARSHMQDVFRKLAGGEGTQEERTARAMECFERAFSAYREHLPAMDAYLEKHSPGHAPGLDPPEPPGGDGERPEQKDGAAETPEYYSGLADSTAVRLTRDRENWTSFLRTSARMSKYPFRDQLLIFAQRPEATACAGQDLWDRIMRRPVRAGSKGIALIDDQGGRPRLRYVFDVSDTDGGRDSRPLNLWQMQEEHRRPVQEAMEKAFGASAASGPSRQLEEIAADLAEGYWQQNREELDAALAGCLPKWYNGHDRKKAFSDAASVSVRYQILSRCVEDPDAGMGPEAWDPVFRHTSLEAAAALGTAVNGMSGRVFRVIEATIRNYERARDAERRENERNEHAGQTDLQESRGRGLPDPEHRGEGVQPGAAGQVRNDAPDVPPGEQGVPVHHPAPEGRTVPAPEGDRRDSAPEAEPADGGASGEGPGPGQKEGPDGLGAAYEQPESAGGGSDLQGTDIHLTEDPERAETDREAKSEELSAFSSAQKTAQPAQDWRRKGTWEPAAGQKVWLEGEAFTVEDVGMYYAHLIPEDFHGVPIFRAESREDLVRLARRDTRNMGLFVLPEASEAADVPGRPSEESERDLEKNTRNDEGMRPETQDGAEKDAQAAGNTAPALAGEPAEKALPDRADEGGQSSETYEQMGLEDLFQGPMDPMNGTAGEDPPSAVYFSRTFTEQIARLYKECSQQGWPLGKDRQFTGLLDGLPPGYYIHIAYRISYPYSEKKAGHRKSRRIEEYIIHHPDGNWEYRGPRPINGLVSAGNGIVRTVLSRAARDGNVAFVVNPGLPETEREHTRAAIESTDDYTEGDFSRKPENIYARNGDGPYGGMSDRYRLVTAGRRDGMPAVVPYSPMIFESREEAEAWAAADDSLEIMDYDSLVHSVGTQMLKESLERRKGQGVAGTPETAAAKPEQPAMPEASGGTDTPGTSKAPEPAVTEETTASYPGEKNGLPSDVEIRTPHFEEPERSGPEPDRDEARGGEPIIDEGDGEAQERPRTVPAQNFRITDDHLGEGGPKLKYARNVAAIRTLLKLEAESRNATPEEQQVLSNYVGWGSLADAFDPDKPAWAQEYQELKKLLSEEEYAAARASTLNAHYTSPAVIKAVYEALGQMGFTGGSILEPSMGVGNFFGLLPEGMRDSRLYGVELDPITGRIARKLYPQADITVGGFETTDRRDFYDVAVGNVPFGDYRVNDRPYNKLGFSIHNYFFAKALDQVRPGGMVAFVTSRYTMDAKSPEVRKYLAQRAELLGAVRLPNNAFRANAGTDVVSDIIFLQKRETPIAFGPPTNQRFVGERRSDGVSELSGLPGSEGYGVRDDAEPDWVHLGLTPEGLAVNSYFVDHPEMVLGELTTESTQYGRQECTVAPFPGADLPEQLHEAVSHIRGSYVPAELSVEDALDGLEAARGFLPADPSVKNFSFAAVDGEVYFRENSVMRQVELNDAAKQRVLGMVELRELVNTLIAYQMEDYPDGDIRAKQQQLETAYDAFTEKYGLLNSRPNARAFADDSSYYLLCSLEEVDEDGKFIGKADMFYKRTIRPDRGVDSVDTPVEALAVSIGERGGVDLPFMAQLLGTPGEYGAAIQELTGVIFRDPLEADENDLTKGWHTADDYLSGNVREKLAEARRAAEADPAYAVNVQALEKAQPKDLDASEIDIRLGAAWVGREYIQQFMAETFKPGAYIRDSIQVNFSPLTAEWEVTGKAMPGRYDVAAYVTYGTERANAYRILEETLNLKDIRIYDTVEDAGGRKRRILNRRETTLAQQKQQAIKDAFRDWVWKDPERRQALCRTYNERFNSIRPREYDGSHIRCAGMNPEICLREHQKNAVARILYGGNTLLAHEVGAGKTFEMAAAAMESKRLGLCQKSLFVVPNHLTTQWANEFLRLYPSARLLVASRRDFEAARRKKFCARIATGDYDAVIIGHSQFEKIPVSFERQQKQLTEQIEELEDAIASLKHARGGNFTIKQMEKTRRSLQAKLDRLTSTERKDDVVTFEQLGVDRLFIDESHFYKNLYLYTKMRNVAGLSTSEAQKSSDLFMKCRYMDEITGGRGVIFATGTPVSNSMTELYTVMRYLQYGTLQRMELTHFDCWASTFGETTTAIELAPEGTGYRARTRFAKFFNLPELMNLFKEAADIRTSDQLDLPVPEAVYKTVVVQPSVYQKEMVQELSERAARVHAGEVDSSQDNMLCITSDGRKIGLDQRLMDPMLPDDPESKLNACVDHVLRIWQDGTPERLTQLLFCDQSTPKGDGSFNVYDDIRSKLTARGVPESEVAFIHDADTEAKKKSLFAKVRTGQVRILLGSTQKMGAGTNVQDRLIAVHHLDVGWRPADMTQRNGRIIRQGNMNKQVQVYQYVTEGTFDAYLYQTLENKQKFISQIMTSKSPVRSCDDVDEQTLSYAEVKALCAGSPLIREKMDLDIDVARLKVLKADHASRQYRLEDQLLKYFPLEIERQRSNIQGFRADMDLAGAHPLPADGFVGMTVGGIKCTEKRDAGKAVLALRKNAKAIGRCPLGRYRGFETELSFDYLKGEYTVALKGSMTHWVPIGSDATGILTRLDHALAGIPKKLEQSEEQLSALRQQQEAARTEIGRPFPQAAELAEKSARLAELDALLNMQDGPEPDELTGVSERTDKAEMELSYKRTAGQKPSSTWGPGL